MAGPRDSRQSTTRRAFLRQAGLGAAGLAVGGPALLAACSSSSSSAREVRVFNQPLAIDDASQSLFETNTGIFVRYHEYTDPVAFLRQNAAALQAHRDIGADVVVLPDLQTRQMIEAGYLRALPGSPPRRRLQPAFANPRFDPGRRFSVPWSSSIVGLAYDRHRVAEAVTSVDTLFDPKFKGRVVMSADPAASLGLTMLGLGQDPSKVTASQVDAAASRVRAAFAAGQIRSFATTEYIDDLQAGRALLAVARSDEVRDAQQVTPSLVFIAPSEGGLLESTNMVVPIGAQNAGPAGEFIDFMLSPQANARLASFSARVTTIEGADKSLNVIDAKAATDPLISTTPAEFSRLRIWGGNAATDAATSQFVAFAAAHRG
jgi:spermidine/putrescine transport system substrate-binding protein